MMYGHPPPWKARRQRRRIEEEPELESLQRQTAELAIDIPTLSQVSEPTFHPFNRLPPELRWDIWQIAISAIRYPRILRIRSKSHIVSQPPYSIANTCREARQMCFKLKRQLFPASNRTVDYIGGSASEALLSGTRGKIFYFYPQTSQCWIPIICLARWGLGMHLGLSV
jgi:hypothetical protein